MFFVELIRLPVTTFKIIWCDCDLLEWPSIFSQFYHLPTNLKCSHFKKLFLQHIMNCHLKCEENTFMDLCCFGYIPSYFLASIQGLLFLLLCVSESREVSPTRINKSQISKYSKYFSNCSILTGEATEQEG